MGANWIISSTIGYIGCAMGTIMIIWYIIGSIKQYINMEDK